MASRAARVLTAWLATAAMLFALAGPVISGHAAIDTECAPALSTTHDHAAHRLGADGDKAPDHCGACHLTRTARDAGRAAATTVADTLVAASVPAPHEPVRRLARRTGVTRGPPALFLS